jgi:hypothetical protein
VLPGEEIQVYANPHVAELMRGEEAGAVDETVKRIHRGIEVHSRKGFHVEHFEIKGKVPAKPGKKRRALRRGDDDDAEASSDDDDASVPAVVAAEAGPSRAHGAREG